MQTMSGLGTLGAMYSNNLRMTSATSAPLQYDI